MILYSLTNPIKTQIQEGDYPFYQLSWQTPKNLITDQVANGANGVPEMFTALNGCGIREGTVCFASAAGNMLPTLLTARSADHATSIHQHNGTRRIMAALTISRQFVRLGAKNPYARLIEGANGNPLNSLHLGFTINPSQGFQRNIHPITVIQKREPTSLVKERDPAFLFGVGFYNDINATTCSSCLPCAAQTPDDLLNTCLPSFESAKPTNNNCKFTCANCTSTSPLLKWQKTAQNATSKGSKTRSNTCFCDCYQELYYHNEGVLQGQQAAYQSRRDTLCRRTMRPLDMVNGTGSMPYINDKALYDFVKHTKDFTWNTSSAPLKQTYLLFNPSIGVCSKKCECEGKCLGNQMRAKNVLMSIIQFINRNGSSNFTAHNYNFVSDYIGNPYNKGNMTNLYCLMSVFFDQMEIKNNTVEIKASLNKMLLDTDLTRLTKLDPQTIISKILFDQTQWTHQQATNRGAIVFAQSTGPDTFLEMQLAFSEQLGTQYYDLTPQFLLLKFLLNSIVIRDPLVQRLTLNQTATVETVLGDLTINDTGNFELTPDSSLSKEIDFAGTSASKASGHIMAALKNEKTAWQRVPTLNSKPLSSISEPLLKRIAGGKGKEIGDYGQQMTGFAGEGTCLTGDINALNRPGLAKKVTVFCRNINLSSREMTQNVRERGDNCFQLFVKPHTTDPNYSMLATHVLQVTPVPPEIMTSKLAQLPNMIEAMSNRVQRLRSIVTKGMVSKIKKTNASL